MNRQNICFTSTASRIVQFLADNSDETFTGPLLAGELELSRGGVNQELRRLIDLGYVTLIQKGKTHLYQINQQIPELKHFKILSAIQKAKGFSELVHGFCQRIILFGSSARGENTSESDIDLYCVSDHKEKVFECLGQYEYPDFHLVVHSAKQYLELEEKNKVLSNAIKKGIVIWETNM